jgi:hypothetical protein
MYRKSLKAILSATQSLFSNCRALILMLAAYAGLLVAIYLFVSTREATIPQLLLTLIVVVAAPVLFFTWQAGGINYAHGPSRIRKVALDGLKLMVVSLPVIALTLLALYGLNKIETHPTSVTTVRYLLLAVIVPLFVIQLWIASSSSGLRSLIRCGRGVLTGTFAPQSLFVYAVGFLFFAVVPYLLLQKSITVTRPWLELSLLVVRLTASALLIFLGWVTTVGAISILSRTNYVPANKA